MTSTFVRGLAAGALGTVVLDAVDYVDMAARGRAASNRRSALGALAGIGNGLATGVAASALRSAGVRLPAPVGAVVAGATSMALTDGAIAGLGVDDPRSSTKQQWLADAVPHLAFGAAVQTVLESVPAAQERADPRGPASAGMVARSALLGVATGCRGSLGLAGPALTAPSRPGLPGRTSGLRKALAVVAVGAELTGDKQPGTPDRTTPGAFSSRLLGASTGASRLAERERVNGALPVLAALAGAAAGSTGGLAWRRWAGTHMPDLQAALLEDGLALLLAAVACLPGRSRPPMVAVPA
jgi:hypothetical protein